MKQKYYDHCDAAQVIEEGQAEPAFVATLGLFIRSIFLDH
jgi:hypothetical protein